MSESPTTLVEILRRAADTGGGIVVGEELRSWADVITDVARRAGSLHGHGVRAGDLVGLHRHKTADSLLTLWAVTWVGAVAVPLDPQLPDAGVVLADLGVTLVVDDATTRRRRDDGPPAVDALELVDGPAIEPAKVSPDDPAYLIHTSGSTGRPKAIVHTHRSAVAFARHAVDRFGLRASDRIAGASPLHFDMSTVELWAAPLAGATVVVVDEAVMRFPASFAARCAAHDVDVWYLVPFFCRQLAERGALEDHGVTVRLLVYAGEPYPGAALRDLWGRIGRPVVINAYGPAETNVVTDHRLDGEPPDEVPIGTAWPGAEVAVVDPDTGAPLPDGEQGVLVVRADTTMVGYRGPGELTARRLRERPELGPGRWYDTGDLGHRDPDGTLWCAGRLDHQIKIRGVRLELEAVEAALANQPGVHHAVAALDGDGEHLVALVVADPDLDVAALRRAVAPGLHPLAVPRRIITADRPLPMTGSGKIDRRHVRADLSRGTS